MKKIIFIYGEPGVGKNTLVKNILNNTDNIRDLLNINTENISVLFGLDGGYRYETKDTRSISVIKGIKEFKNSNYELLLVYGDIKDFSNKFDSTLIRINKEFPDIEKELYFLTMSDLDLLYERLVKSKWFQSNYDENKRRYPRVWLDIAINYIRKTMNRLIEEGYSVKEIDTTNGYNIIDGFSKSK